MIRFKDYITESSVRESLDLHISGQKITLKCKDFELDGYLEANNWGYDSVSKGLNLTYKGQKYKAELRLGHSQGKMGRQATISDNKASVFIAIEGDLSALDNMSMYGTKAEPAPLTLNVSKKMNATVKI